MFYTILISMIIRSFNCVKVIRQERKHGIKNLFRSLEKVKLATSRLPIDVKELLTNHIDSVGHLEVLLTFFNNQTRSWTASSLSQELRSHETIVSTQIQKLVAHGFIKETSKDEFIYSTTTEALNFQVDILARTYREMSVAVIAFIYEKPTDKLKGFADAFKLKKD